VTRLLLYAALILMPAEAAAQTIATNFADLSRLLKSGDTVQITDANGRTLRGRIGDLSPQSLELMARKRAPDGTEPLVPVGRFVEADVRQIRVQRRDSVLNGTLIGLGVGLGIAIIPAAGIFCSSTYEGGVPLSSCLSFLATLGGIGAGTGLAIDAVRTPSRMIYYQAAVRF
jgi:hypothetical protein